MDESGTTILLITHDANVAARADRVLFLCDGKIMSEINLGKFSEADFEQRVDKVMQKMHSIGI